MSRGEKTASNGAGASGPLEPVWSPWEGLLGGGINPPNSWLGAQLATLHWAKQWSLKWSGGARAAALGFLRGPALQARLLLGCSAQLCTGKWPLSPSPGLLPATRLVLKP